MKTTRNDFSGGRNTDTSLDKLQPNQYTEAYNIELVEGGEYFAAQNLLGTTQVKEILDNNDVLELGVFANKYLIDGTEYNCLTIFTVVPNDKFKIWCYNTQTTDLYELFEEDVPSDYIADDRIIDAVVYPESGVDFLYFTDFYNELRFLKCEINSYTPNFLTAYDISLLRRGANGTILLDDIGAGGTLLTGTYQFSYRMVDPVNKRFTKWSSLTNPFHVYKEGSSTDDPVYAGIGLLSNKKITLTITPTDEEIDNFSYIQVAVIENISDALTVSASLLEIEQFFSSPISLEYISNTNIGTIPIDDIVVPLAAIKTLKTLKVKQNRLFGANVKYYDLEADNGTPEITSGSISTFVTGVRDTYSDDIVASSRKGYFRDEVYRFGVKFSDKYGNERIFPLDLDGKVSGNQISAGLPDMKFPSRSTSSTYSIWSTTNKLKGLGLSFTGLTNVPSWAVSAEIVRVPRKKNILFQTPVVPMVTVQGIGATSYYPTLHSVTIGSDVVSTTITDAQPMTPNKVLVPKNLFIPEARNILQNGFKTGSQFNLKTKSEVHYERVSSYDVGAVFPPDSMYSSTPFSFTGSEVLDVVDYVLLRCNSEEFRIAGSDTASYDTGDFVETSITGTFYALSEDAYFFDSTWSGKTIPASDRNVKLTEYEFFDNFSTGKSLAGNSTLDYDGLQTTGIGFWQYKPNAQKMGVFQMGSTMSCSDAKTFKAGVQNAVSNGGFVIGSGGIRYDFTFAIRNDYVTDYASYTDNSSYISRLSIANISLGLSDDRYGDINVQHEYISTGAKYSFSESEINTLLSGGDISIDFSEIWGGDCFLSPFLFKVSDSAYSITNQGKNFTSPTPESRDVSTAKWGAFYQYNTDGINPTMTIPVAVKNSAQFIQVVLESEYNVVDQDITTDVYDASGIPVMGVEAEASLRSPLTYRYNINLNKENSQRVYFPKPQFGFEQNEFRARLVYTDLKIYNSDQAGFDIIRAGNFFDLEENRYAVTKLALAGDNLYAIQQKGVVYVPTGERQIEQTDGGQLAVRSGEVITRPLVIDAIRGSQHIRGIIETGGRILIPDNINKSVYVLSGQELAPITENNETIIETLFNDIIPEKDVIGFYDPARRTYWLVVDGNCQVYSEHLQLWMAEHEFTNLVGGVYQNQQLFLNGKPGTALNTYTMYTGNENEFFGETVVPRIKVCVNPDDSFSKTFENFMFDASDRLNTVDFEVQRESFLGNQVINGTNLDVLSIENNFRIKAPRDSNKSKLRGMRMLMTVKWGELQSSLKSIWTKYNMSARTPW